MKKLTKVLFTMAVLMQVWACKEKTVEPGEENELITTVKLELTEGSNTQTFKYVDMDGDGGKAPQIDAIQLKANTTYSVKVSFLNEAQSPVEDITQEIADEADEHLIIFTSSPLSLVSYSYKDVDSNNLPIGLKGELKTNAAGQGKLKLQLRHQPPIGTKPSKNGSPEPGSDDVNIDFDLAVK